MPRARDEACMLHTNPIPLCSLSWTSRILAIDESCIVYRLPRFSGELWVFSFVITYNNSTFYTPLEQYFEELVGLPFAIRHCSTIHQITSASCQYNCLLRNSSRTNRFDRSLLQQLLYLRTIEAIAEWRACKWIVEFKWKYDKELFDLAVFSSYDSYVNRF